MNELDQLLQSPASLILLVTNIGVSLAAFRNEQLLDKLLFDVSRMRRNGEWYRMFTSGFVHGDPFHLFVNMLALYFLGLPLESIVGTAPFLGIYIGALLAGSLWTWMEHFRDLNYRALGASGAISGVTTAVAMFVPTATIYVFFALPMPLILFAALYIGWSAWASSTGVRDGLGHAAHLGGALAGIAIICIGWPDIPQQMVDQIMARVRGF